MSERVVFGRGARREQEVALAFQLAEAPWDSPALVAWDESGTLVPRMGAVAWHRFAGPGRVASPLPPDGPFASASLRLPLSKASLDFAVTTLADRLIPAGRLLVYGRNDEGIRSAEPCLARRFKAVETLDTRRHGRVLMATGPEAQPQRGLAAFALARTLALPGVPPRPWTSYPGLFADGALDEGTACLLRALPALPAGATVLDYACGTGVIGAALPDVTLTAVDADALAVLATQANLPKAQVLLNHELPASLGRFDLIVSNPPIHRGKEEDYGVLAALIERSPAHLTPGGQLVLVVQRQVPIAPLLSAMFAKVERPVETGRFHVYRATQAQPPQRVAQRSPHVRPC